MKRDTEYLAELPKKSPTHLVTLFKLDTYLLLSARDKVNESTEVDSEDIDANNHG